MIAIIVRVFVGTWLFWCRSWELFVGEIVWWFLFEGYELDDLRKSLDVDCSSSDYYYGNFINVGL